ncbi:unnamed protein product, partial [Chrysoparadoxa australica]
MPKDNDEELHITVKKELGIADEDTKSKQRKRKFKPKSQARRTPVKEESAAPVEAPAPPEPPSRGSQRGRGKHEQKRGAIAQGRDFFTATAVGEDEMDVVQSRKAPPAPVRASASASTSSGSSAKANGQGEADAEQSGPKALQGKGKGKGKAKAAADDEEEALFSPMHDDTDSEEAASECSDTYGLQVCGENMVGHNPMKPIHLPFSRRPDDGVVLGPEPTEAEKDELFFIQLPSVLPKILSNPSEETPPGVKQEDPSSSEAAAVEPEADAVNPFKHVLDGVPSGKLGKLRIRKSGKAELVIGDCIFEVSTGIQKDFYQEVVAVDLEEK